MTEQHRRLVAISGAMCAHALWIGHFLGSPFAIDAVTWLWIGGAAELNRLEAAQVMAIVMSVLLFAASIGLSVANSVGTNTVAHLSLALGPAVVTFACVAFCVRHLRQQAAAG